MRRQLFRFGIAIFVIGSYIFVCSCLSSSFVQGYSNEDNHDKNSINEVQSDSVHYDSDDYARLIISKIGVDRPLYPLGSKENTVDKNVEILKTSSMPDVESGNLILAAHNGYGLAAYFNRLHELAIGDEVTLSYNDVDYNYVISDIYDVEKTGKVAIKRDKSKTTITMITCLGEDRQLVVIGYLR